MWEPLANRPEWDRQPIRQFILLEGQRMHSDLIWRRVICGTASVDRDGPFGYRAEDIERLCRDGDMEPLTAAVTHWMPATYPPLTTADAAHQSPRFPNTGCSQCGGQFGPGDHGYSHCENHKGKRRLLPSEETEL